MPSQRCLTGHGNAVYKEGLCRLCWDFLSAEDQQRWMRGGSDAVSIAFGRRTLERLGMKFRSVRGLHGGRHTPQSTYP